MEPSHALLLPSWANVANLAIAELGPGPGLLLNLIPYADDRDVTYSVNLHLSSYPIDRSVFLL